MTFLDWVNYIWSIIAAIAGSIESAVYIICFIWLLYTGYKNKPDDATIMQWIKTLIRLS